MTIKIAEKELPLRRSLGAMLKFDKRFKGEMSVLKMDRAADLMTVEHMAALLWFMIEAGMKFEGIADDEVTEEWVYENADVEDLAVLTQTMADADSKKKPKAVK